MLPTLCDLTSSTLSFFSMGMLPISVYSMLGNAGIIFTALFSVVFLKRRLFSHHILGLVTNILGVITIGAASLNKESKENENTLIGIFVLLFSLIFASSHLII